MRRTIENLVVWKQARTLVNDIYNLMRDCKDYGFKDQIQRAAVSIMNNIAEGAESGSDARFVYFLNIARGSCAEVRSMTYLCEDFGFCNSDETVKLQNQLKIISSGLLRLINSMASEENK